MTTYPAKREPIEARGYETDNCSIEGCEEPRFARGYCSLHYFRIRRTGRPDRGGQLGRIEPRPQLSKHETREPDLRRRPQSAEHVAKRITAMRATLEASVRVCVACGESYSPTSGGQRFCSRRCYDAEKKRREAKWEKSKRLRIPPGLRRELLSEHGVRCGICGQQEKRHLCVDHDHATGTIRGLLCGRCNRAIGLLDDNPVFLEKAIRYLASHDPDTARRLP